MDANARGRRAGDAAGSGTPAREAGRVARDHSGLAEKYIAGVPARIMRPRLVFLACLVALVGFGVIMVYSASSVEALKEGNPSTYYLFRQALFAAVGGIILVIATRRWFPWPLIEGDALRIVIAAFSALLIFVRFFGQGAGGATRWVTIAGFTLQPSELLKPFLIMRSAQLLDGYYLERTLPREAFIRCVATDIVIPLALVFFQPDMGSTLIIFGALFLMAVFAGLEGRVIAALAVFVVLAGALAIFIEPYRLERLKVVMDPWSDPYDSGYQATLAIMAFASGGLTGRGIGNSTMKYNYLPEAHNDYILAIIGEELGFIGTVLFFALFCGLIWSAFKIAERASSNAHRLMAEGAALILILQFLVNALGIIGVIPMTGKTMPFISYGGSSLIASFMLAALVMRVSLESGRSAPYRERRDRLTVMSKADAVSSHLGRSSAGVPRRRSDRDPAPAGRPGFSVLDGPSAAPHLASARPGAHPPARASSAPLAGSSSRSGYDRVDLGADPADRLRPRGQTTSRRGRGDTRR